MRQGVRKGRHKKVKCPRCSQRVGLNSKGLIRSHSREGGSMFSRYVVQCSGTNTKPE